MTAGDTPSIDVAARSDVRALIELAIAEDVGRGDLTAALLPDPRRRVSAAIVAREDGIVAGLPVLDAVVGAFHRRLGCALAMRAHSTDGRFVSAGETVATVEGEYAALLTAERTLLNFASRLAGVATLTARYVEAARLGNPAVAVLDTRKTTPGWRALEKYAVRCGGGTNHRDGLYDAVLIKDNHLAGVELADLRDYVAGLVGRVSPEAAFIEVEVDRLAQLEVLLGLPRVGLFLLDNFTVDQLAEAVALRDARSLRGAVQLEASGGVRLETITRIAASGVDRISVGALTHSAVALDLGLDVSTGNA